MEQHMKKFKKTVTKCEQFNLMIAHFKKMLASRSKAGHTYFEDIESDINDKVNWLTEQLKNFETLNEKKNQFIEY